MSTWLRLVGGVILLGVASEDLGGSISELPPMMHAAVVVGLVLVFHPVRFSPKRRTRWIWRDGRYHRKAWNYREALAWPRGTAC